MVRSISRSAGFEILPTAFFGSASSTKIARGQLVTSERGSAALVQLVASGGRVGSERNVGDGLLAQHVVRTPDDSGFKDVGMPVEDVLDLLRIDVLASADDHVLQPVDEHQVAVIVEVADVTSV